MSVYEVSVNVTLGQLLLLLSSGSRVVKNVGVTQKRKLVSTEYDPKLPKQIHGGNVFVHFLLSFITVGDSL